MTGKCVKRCPAGPAVLHGDTTYALRTTRGLLTLRTADPADFGLGTAPAADPG